MNFTRTFISVSSGTDIFIKLLKVPFFRALYHLLLLAFFCSIMVLAGLSFSFSGKLDDTLKALSENFGTINISEKGILPEKDPETPRTVILANDFRVDYFPEKESSFNDLGKYGADRGIAWNPELIFLWGRLFTEKKYQPDVNILSLYAAKKNKILLPANEPLDENKLATYLNENLNVKEGAVYLHFGSFFTLNSERLAKGGSCSFENLKEVFLAYYCFRVFFIHFSEIIFTTVIFTSIMAIVYTFVGKDALSKLTADRLMVIGVYVAFPAIFIGSLFKALSVPILSYQTIFLIAFLVYLFPVFNRIQTFLNPNENKDDESLV